MPILIRGGRKINKNTTLLLIQAFITTRIESSGALSLWLPKNNLVGSIFVYASK
jgi:hypothetical protein